MLQPLETHCVSVLCYAIEIIYVADRKQKLTLLLEPLPIVTHDHVLYSIVMPFYSFFGVLSFVLHLGVNKQT